MKERLLQLAEQAKREYVYPSTLFPPSVYYRFLKLLAQEYKSKVMVELGVCGGGGSLHMAIGNPDGKVIGVDYQYDHPESVGFIERNYSNFTFFLHDSKTAAPKVFEKYGAIDLLFIDTDHTYQSTIDEYAAWKPYLSENAIVCFDDLLRHHPDDKLSMEDAWKTIEGNKLRIDYLHDGTYPHGGGFGIVW